MKTPWRERTQDCVATARFFLCAVLLFSIFVQTRQQQRDIKSKWDKRLLPTNSVYEQPQEFVLSAGNVPSIRSLNENKVMKNSKGVDRSLSVDNEEAGEEIYDEDYDLEETEEGDEEEAASKRYSASPSPKSLDSREDNVKNGKLRLGQPKDSPIDHEDTYYYYDDYENATSPENEASDKHLLAYFDTSDDISVSSSSEKHPTISKASPEETSTRIPSTERPAIEESSRPDDSPSPSIPDLSAVDRKHSQEESYSLDGEILIGEAVVSVVTTKSVVNGTISVPVSPLPMTTEQILAPMIPSSTPNPGVDYSTRTYSGDAAETTEDSRIVASVQTSRSISGARFLPFLVVEGNEKNLPEDEETSPASSTVRAGSDEEVSPASATRKTPPPQESTESIIDKLDRVQSELSSGFLAGGFRTSGNTLQLDVLGEQRPSHTRKSFTTTSRTPVISKFIPRRYNQERKASTPSSSGGKIAEVSLSTEREDDNNGLTTERIKFRWPSSSRNSRPGAAESNSAGKNSLRNFGSAASVKQKPGTPAPSSDGAVRDISAFLPAGYKLKKEDSAVTESSLLSDIFAKSKVDISSLLPVNYKPEVSEEKSTENDNGEVRNSEEDESVAKIPAEKNFESLFAKTKVDVLSLLPVDYSADRRKIGEATKAKEGTLENSRGAGSVKPDKSLHDLFTKTSVDISALLPPDYNRFKKDETAKSEKLTSPGLEGISEAPTIKMTSGTTVKPAGGIKLVFPSRPGGRKAVHKATTHSSRGDSAGGNAAVSPRIQKGWPTRATTEFTGWPAPSTTPISIEKLLEAARTATVASTNVSVVPTTSTSSTTTTSTTTTTTPRPTTPGTCEDECEVAGTIRIVENAAWVPELLDRNTQEWQQLAEDIEKEMNLVFLKSSVLRKWYKRIRIDAFSPGSILVDYFIELTDLRQRINTQELKVIFHDSLRTYNSDKWNETRAKGPIRLGAFALDPKSTDFVVIPKVSAPQHIGVDDRLIPQWAIAVIVIGVGGLLFIIVFGVSVLVNRQSAARLKPSPVVYSEEVAKNIIQASHGAPSHRSSQDYPKSEISTIWNDTDVWRDKSFESNSNEILVDGTMGHERNIDRRIDERKYNMYDSWRSEWNGYYCNQSQGSSKFAGYESTTNLSRHPPDYDTNF